MKCILKFRVKGRQIKNNRHPKETNRQEQEPTIHSEPREGQATTCIATGRRKNNASIKKKKKIKCERKYFPEVGNMIFNFK